MATDYEKAVDALCSDIRDLRADLKAVVSAVRDGAAQKASSAKESMQEMAASRLEQIKRAACAVRDTSQRTYRKVHETVEERPMASVLAAVGIGFALGALIRWRRG